MKKLIVIMMILTSCSSSIDVEKINVKVDYTVLERTEHLSRKMSPETGYYMGVVYIKDHALKPYELKPELVKIALKHDMGEITFVSDSTCNVDTDTDCVLAKLDVSELGVLWRDDISMENVTLRQ